MTTTATNNDHDGHKQWPWTMTMMATTMTATNHDDQLGEIYPTMLKSSTVHLPLVFHIFIAVAVMVMDCGRHGHVLWPLSFVAVMVYTTVLRQSRNVSVMSHFHNTFSHYIHMTPSNWLIITVFHYIIYYTFNFSLTGKFFHSYTRLGCVHKMEVLTVVGVGPLQVRHSSHHPANATASRHVSGWLHFVWAHNWMIITDDNHYKCFTKDFQ